MGAKSTGHSCRIGTAKPFSGETFEREFVVLGKIKTYLEKVIRE